MSNKIKSIKVELPITQLSFQSFTIEGEQIKKLTEEQLEFLEEMNEKFPEVCKVEHEKPKKRYNPNGSLFDEPEEGEKVWILGPTAIPNKWLVEHITYRAEYSKNKILGEISFDSKEEAEAEAERLKKHREIKRKLQEINFKNNWEADWSDSGQEKFVVFWRHEEDRADWATSGRLQGMDFFMCEQAKDYLLRLPKEDQKAFLGVFN